MKKEIMEGILEELASLEHEQWMAWSKNIAQTELLKNSRLKRWEKLWVPYEQLTEEEKGQDRIWAAKVMTAIIKALEGKDK